jgi:hypothetical protein
MIFRAFMGLWPIDKIEGFVKDRDLLSGDGTPRVGQGTVEDDTLCHHALIICNG